MIALKKHYFYYVNNRPVVRKAFKCFQMLSQQARMKQAFSHTCFLMPKGKLAACQFNLMYKSG